MKIKIVDFYDSLPYKMVLTPDVEDGGYVASFPDLPGCITCADTHKKRQQRTRRMQNGLGLKPHWKAMQKSMNQRSKFKESYIISKNFMQWGLEAMEKDLQQQYLDTESNSRLFFDTFFELCRKFNIQYSIATTQEKAFIDEATESIYERKKAERDGKVPTYQQQV